MGIRPNMLTRNKKIKIAANTMHIEELPAGEFIEYITYHHEAEGLISLDTSPSMITDIRYRITNTGDTYEREITLWIGKK